MEQKNLRKAVLSEFVSHFAPDAVWLYEKPCFNEQAGQNQKIQAILQELKLIAEKSQSLPDVILYSLEKDWLYFFETETIMDSARVTEIEKMTEQLTCGKLYFTVFPNRLAYQNLCEDIAWGTVVWLADTPEHMIHYDDLSANAKY